ncbi:DUF512 domain-containing protein [candidate division KSB1 bacterium]|nr:DUF512 domain-containing protein [candidate division KSB1 bacterium]
MKILSVQERGVAWEMGIRSGDELLEINGNPIRDIIDYHFWAFDTPLELKVRQPSGLTLFEVDFPLDEEFGIEPDPISVQCCGNKCVFCFVDQNPQGLRPSLYVKDEDIRLSFLYGNYVTLTRVGQPVLQRIVDQQLSPLYISVHATDPIVRKKMLGIKGNDRLLEKIDFLARHKITMHAQIVLCPGWNDGEILQDTIDTLKSFYPAIASIAIVPVGLTRHRRNLPLLHAVTPQKARQVIAWHKAIHKSFRHAFGTGFLYLADEFYLLANARLPARTYYDDFVQIENGVGMVRDFLDTFAVITREMPTSIKPLSILVVTGSLAAPIFESRIVNKLAGIRNLAVKVRAIKNTFYGESVTVSGLLTGQDIAEQVSNEKKADIIMLPPNCLNESGYFLDDWTPENLQERLQIKIHATESHFDEMIAYMEKDTK